MGNKTKTKKSHHSSTRNHKQPLATEQITTPCLKNVRSVEDDLKCPICLELPVDPVMAEDGKIYEREYIYRYFMSSSKNMKDDDDKVKSPITNELISKKLISAHQIKSHIETLIMYGMIRGEIARKWQSKALKQSWKDEALNGNGRTVETMQSLTAKIDDLMASLELSARDDDEEEDESWMSKTKSSKKSSKSSSSSSSSYKGRPGRAASSSESGGGGGAGTGGGGGSISSLGDQSAASAEEKASSTNNDDCAKSESVNTHTLINHLLDKPPPTSTTKDAGVVVGGGGKTSTLGDKLKEVSSSTRRSFVNSKSSKKKTKSLKKLQLPAEESVNSSDRSTGLSELLELYFPMKL